MYEIELKAHVQDVKAVREALNGFAKQMAAVLSAINITSLPRMSAEKVTKKSESGLKTERPY